MDATTISQLIKGLGYPLNDLVSSGVLNNQKPTATYDDPDWLTLEPVPGIELGFWRETEALEKVLISLDKMFEDDTLYTGELPSPFTLNMDKTSVRGLLGEPTESKEPFRMPVVGMVGGWDAYPLQGNTNANARVHFSYNANMRVRTLGFMLSDTGRI